MSQFSTVYREFVSVTPNDSTVYSPPLAGLLVVAADATQITVQDPNGNSVTLTGQRCAEGAISPFQISRVMSAGTTLGSATAVGLR